MKRAQLAMWASLAGCMALSFSSCSSCFRSLPPGGASRGGASTSPVPPNFYTPPGAVYDVKYTANTVRIDLPTVQKTLRSVSPDAAVFVFDDSDPRIRGLAQGNMMFLEHLGVRRVIKVQNQNSQVAVLTEPAALTDFIQDGRIQFSMPVNFSRLQAQSVPPANQNPLLAGFKQWFEPPELVYASGEENGGKIGVHTKGEIDNWEFEIEGEPKGDGLELSLDAGKKLAGLTASVKAKAELEHVNTAFNAVIHGGTMQEFDYSTPLKGNLDLNWSALTSGQNSGIGESRLKLPPFAKQVIDVYGLPLLFKIDEALIFTPGFGTPHDAAEGKLSVKYDGTEGLSVHGGQSSPQGTMDVEPTAENQTSESLAAHGIVLAVDAPKVSVSIGTESITEAIKESIPKSLTDKVAQFLENGPFGLGGLAKSAKENFFKIEGAAYVQLVTEFDYTASGPLSLVPCTMTHINLNAQSGVDAQLLGMKGESPHADIFKKTWTRRNPDVPICGQKGQQ
ncbi:MAG: hypothetical protein ACYDA9_02160 [Terriglobia bacterium]